MSRNLLDGETSPYLLQHKDNPVHWRAWGPEALEAARAENKPIMLSVGYAACHWCHVMAHESFEDQATGDLINSLFIAIKVDREERPDIDSIYQTALALLGQQGGWPLTMFLTPKGEPFWGGTYFPNVPRYGRPSFKEILLRITQVWREQPDNVAGNVKAIADALAQHGKPEGTGSIDPKMLDNLARSALQLVDPQQGGLRGAPKFPQVPLFEMMWRAWVRIGNANCRDAVLVTLDHMCQGGIYDHLGGGFARYSTDEHWLVPHFEKMLYDNAEMIELLVQAWRGTRSPLYARRIEETIGWVLREMIADHGAFAATLDADSEGEEGKYYVWTADEIEALLPGPIAADFMKLYDVTPTGNWEGSNILHRNHDDGEGSIELDARLEGARAILLAARQKRIPPGRDDKVLADWNGMMIAAMAQAAFAFDRSDWLDAAKRAFDAVFENMSKPADRLGHSLRLGRLQPEAMIDDYAQMSRAALILFEITGEESYLAQAKKWVAVADAHYWDADKGGYFFTADDAPGLILRSKTALDHATPSGNGIISENLARLYHIDGDEKWRKRADEVIAAFSGEFPRAFPSMAVSLNSWELLEHEVRVALIGMPGSSSHTALLRSIAESAPPAMVLIQAAPRKNLPAGFDALSIKEPAALVCRGTTCSLPLTTPDALRAELTKRPT